MDDTARAALPDGSFPIQGATDLKTAIRLVDNASNPAATMAHIITRAKALGLTRSLPKGWTTEKAYADIATLTGIACPECSHRRFFSDEAFLDHAAKVHTFDDIRRLVGAAISDKYAVRSSGTSPSTYVWVEDMTDAWAVYCQDSPTGMDLYQVPYSIDNDDNVTLGDTVEVIRRTVYDPVSGD